MAWHPTLDNMESRPDGPQQQNWGQFRDNRDPDTIKLAMGSGDCWCGGELCDNHGHWPGVEDGAPHPRKPRP